MYRRNKFGIALRAIVVAVTASGMVAAHAGFDDLGVLNLGFTSTNPGLTGLPSNFTDYSGSYTNWAGGVNWAATGTATAYTGSSVNTICSSFNQNFDTGVSTPFVTELYSLNQATGGAGGTVTLHDTTVLSLPGADVPPETGNSFLEAAALFGKEYNNSQTNLTSAALQLAVWQVLYMNTGAFQPTFGGGTPGLSTQEAAYYNEATGFTSAQITANIANVQWADFTGSSSSNGQGQFRLPGATPEPFTLAMGAAALAVAARRRSKSRKA